MALPKDIDARKFYRVANKRLYEARLILDKLELYAASEYLGGYAVECILKALVLTVTPASQRPPAGDRTIDWLKTEFGHGLDALRRWVVARGARRCRATLPIRSCSSPPGTLSRGTNSARGVWKDAERFLSAAASIVRWANDRM